MKTYRPSFYIAQFSLITAMMILCLTARAGKIDRHAVVSRNNPHITTVDTLASLSVGNGGFCFTVDVTGLQSFPQHYSHGVPLGTQSDWGWHSFPNPNNFTPQEALRSYNFGRGHEELYSCQFKTGRQKEASDYLRANPHRLHLGVLGFADITPDQITSIDQTLDLWNGTIHSSFCRSDNKVRVTTCCHPDNDRITAEISDPALHPLALSLPYPTGNHSDDACNWTNTTNHHSKIIYSDHRRAIVSHILDDFTYYIDIRYSGAEITKISDNRFLIQPQTSHYIISEEFLPQMPDIISQDTSSDDFKQSSHYWNQFWQSGGIVDFSHCTDPRAMELERRVVLSQYLLAIQCAGSTPPQETGLTYNSWFGKYHLEMIWWHQAQFALWGHPELLARSLPWYKQARQMAREIASRQGFKGVRWMKMTDPSAQEAPSNVGSFLIWQQPHIIYLATLLYRATHDQRIIDDYYDLVEETAEFMADYVEKDSDGHYILRGCIPAQETLKASETVNPPFELSYWHFGLQLAQMWRELRHQPLNAHWDDIITNLSPLASEDSVYKASSDSPSYNSANQKPDLQLYSDHMAVLAALGVLPYTKQVDTAIMLNTLNWVLRNWNWDKTWGWDYPTTCMNAVRLHQPSKAVDALLMGARTNTYLPNGHNYQDSRLRCYLPGNGGLLTAVALMCAGWDNSTTTNPGFPHDGTWDVRWEGLLPLP